MTVDELLGRLVLLIGVPLNLYVTAKLLVLARSQPTFRVLRERAIVAVCVLLVVVVFGLIFLNNDTIPPFFGTDTTKIITRIAVLIVATVPALYWLRLYR